MKKRETMVAIVALMMLVFMPCFTFAVTKKTEVKKTPQIRVLIIPGHDKESSGTEYKGLKEAQMTQVLGERIYNELSKDKRFKVYISRKNNEYTKTFADYFKNKENEIYSFKEKLKEVAKEEVASGYFAVNKSVPHVGVSAKSSIKLYGINKWANDNNIDLVLHVHFNDAGRVSFSTIGNYHGFTVYYPDVEFLNSTESKKIGKDIFNQLKKNFEPSTYPKENGGFVSDQSLIAMGSNKSLNKDTRTVLIEYGYIYEKIMRNSKTRRASYDKMAKLTVAGIKNYFFPKKS